MGAEGLLAETVADFSRRARERVRAVADAVRAHDAAEAARLAHMIAGSAGTLGAVRLDRVARALEAALQSGEPQKTEEALDRLIGEVEPTLQALAAASS